MRVAAGPNGVVRLWDPSLTSWRRQACAVADRDLTLVEWSTFVGADIPYRRTRDAVLGRS